MAEAEIRRVLGIEGTAWAASAAVYAVETDAVTIHTEAYEPDSGGIHPREAAEHMAEHLPDVAERALADARDLAREEPSGADAPPVDAVAFSRGPGLGPCLRLAATTARSLAQRLDVPLVGVNHMVAHLEVARHRSGFDDPICLNASGANAHVLAYRNGRYRVLGETMDTGVGNAIDKFTRHLGWSHPGGPKVEEAATEGEYVELPHVVKGMDFSFAGISSAAKEAVDEGVPVEDVCRGLEETIFAMLTEVTERALSLTNGDRLVLGGGVGQNERLEGMLREMCDQRGAELSVPEARFLRDNAGMIAVLGAKMAAAGDTLALADSRIDADFRPDEVPVTWREDAPSRPLRADAETIQGAEATVTIGEATVNKERAARTYRHPALDERLRRRRTRQEARLLHEGRVEGVPTPVVHDVDPAVGTLVVGRVGDRELRDSLDGATVRAVAGHLATLHRAGLVHGDPTTRNVRVDDHASLIDFGLGYYSRDAEDHAMDLHVLRQSLAGTADDPAPLLDAVLEAYEDAGDPAVLDRLAAVEGRGRYR
jgi:N6-L-threonylcarbamoyladenine synthase/protein kinase Bud32